jgi:D-threonine aldolase
MHLQNWYEIANANEIASPTLLLYPDRIEENLRRLIAMAGDPGRLRPHVKTHKLPQIIAMKRALGIDKFKVSTIAEAEMTAQAGGRDVLLAYPCVGPNVARFAELVRRFPQTRFATLVDNPVSLAELAATATAAGVTIELLVDLNVGMNRTGIAPGEQAVELYRQLSSTGGITAGGLHAYDGHVRNTDYQALVRHSEQTFAAVTELVQTLRGQGLDVPRIVAGGTPTSSLLVHHRDTEVGSGTPVLWDFGQEEMSPDLDYLNAAVLLSRVVSRPLPGHLCLDLGYKAVASEMPQPRVRWFGLEQAEVVGQSEEHLVIKTDLADDYPVGRVVYGVPRHICPTVALQSEVWCVRDGRAVERWPVVARARRLSI